MSSLRKIAEAKKANIRADAERRAAEVDRDMENLEILTAKYGLALVDPSIATAQAIEVVEPDQEEAGEIGVEVDISTHDTPQAPINGVSLGAHGNGNGVVPPIGGVIMARILQDGLGDASVTKRARAAADAYIRARKRPVPLSELDEALAANGIRFESDNSRSVLSAVLGQVPNFYSISRDRGWWLRDLGEPPPMRRRLV
jgi:hypothetical protein